MNTLLYVSSFVMLKKHAFANAAALTSAIAYLIAYVGYVATPEAFRYWFNAQFLGADVSALVPALSSGEFTGFLITVAVTGWICGYVFAWTYNQFGR